MSCLILVLLRINRQFVNATVNAAFFFTVVVITLTFVSVVLLLCYTLLYCVDNILSSKIDVVYCLSIHWVYCSVTLVTWQEDLVTKRENIRVSSWGAALISNLKGELANINNTSQDNTKFMWDLEITLCL